MSKLAPYPQSMNAGFAQAGAASGAAASAASYRTAVRAVREGSSGLPFALALIAVILQFTLSGNSLNDLGIHYSMEGGNPLFKFHPATYLTFCAAAIAVLSLPRGKPLSFFEQRSGLTAFLIITAASSVWSVLNVGFSGSAVFVESYLSAGALAIVLDLASPQQRRMLAKAIIFLLVLNVAIAVYEGLTQQHLIPIYYSEKDRLAGVSSLDPTDGEFRGAALYTHPLSGALFTAMGVFLVMALDLSFAWAAVVLCILGVGLLAFGGRAALLVTAMLLMVKGSGMILHDLAFRRWNPALIGAVALTLVVVIPAGAIIVAATPIGDRIMSRLYYDDSAQVRDTQWRVFDDLDRSDWVYGVPIAKQDTLIFNARAEAIENPLILMFFSLGGVVLPVFLFGFAAFALYLNSTCPQGRWLLYATLMIIFTNNSVGTKCSDLFIMTACLFAISNPRSEAAAAGSPAAVRSNRAPRTSGRSYGKLTAQPQFRARNIGATPEAKSRALTQESPF